jgi:hypothetical protein
VHGPVEERVQSLQLGIVPHHAIQKAGIEIARQWRFAVVSKGLILASGVQQEFTVGRVGKGSQVSLLLVETIFAANKSAHLGWEK